MKKSILFIAILAIFSNCRSESDSESKSVGDPNNLVGTWKKSTEIIYSGSNNSVIATYPNDDNCEKNSSTEYTNDNKVLFRSLYLNSAGNCVQYPTQTQNYTYDNTTKKLFQNNVLYGEILKLTNNKLDVRVQLGDENNDGVNDYAVEYGYK